MDALPEEIQAILDSFTVRPIPPRVEDAIRRGYCKLINRDELAASSPPPKLAYS